MARKSFEGSPQDVAEDRRMAKKAGMSMKDWEKSPADKKHDAGGIAVRGHKRKAPGPRRPPAPPAPGQTEFSPEQETAMRQGARAARSGPVPQPLPPAGGGDDYGGV